MVRMRSGRQRQKSQSSPLGYALYCMVKKPAIGLTVVILGTICIYSVLFQKLSEDSSSNSINNINIGSASGVSSEIESVKKGGSALVDADELAGAEAGLRSDAEPLEEMMKKVHFEPRHRHKSNKNLRQAPKEAPKEAPKKAQVHVALPEADAAVTEEGQCLSSLSQLTRSELQPRKGPRHLAQPPSSPNHITLVCCHTTAGALSLAVHKNWAPNGAQHFINLTNADFFTNSGPNPFYRCTPGNEACQFGITSDPDITMKYMGQLIPDDYNWLARNNTNPDARIARRGYLTFAGTGPNSRSSHFMIIKRDISLGDKGHATYDESNKDNDTPWLVPFAELVGAESYRALDNIFPGYESGPSPNLLIKHGFNNYAKKKYPLVDYIKDCDVVEEKSFPSQP